MSANQVLQTGRVLFLVCVASKHGNAFRNRCERLLTVGLPRASFTFKATFKAQARGVLTCAAW